MQYTFIHLSRPHPEAGEPAGAREAGPSRAKGIAAWLVSIIIIIIIVIISSSIACLLFSKELLCRDPGIPASIRQPFGRAAVGAKYCTPEIDTSEIIVDSQWHFPTDLQ